MAEDREQERAEERDGTARPVTAAARRERRASARQGAVRGEGGQASSAPRTRRGKGDPAADVAERTDTATPGTAKKGRPTPARDRQASRPPAIKRAARFLREVVSELRKVIWPTRKQQFTYTVVVLVFVTVIVALVFGLDTLFDRGVFWVFG